jgi:hypothetical protein
VIILWLFYPENDTCEYITEKIKCLQHKNIYAPMITTCNWATASESCEFSSLSYNYGIISIFVALSTSISFYCDRCYRIGLTEIWAWFSSNHKSLVENPPSRSNQQQASKSSSSSTTITYQYRHHHHHHHLNAARETSANHSKFLDSISQSSDDKSSVTVDSVMVDLELWGFDEMKEIQKNQSRRVKVFRAARLMKLKHIAELSSVEDELRLLVDAHRTLGSRNGMNASSHQNVASTSKSEAALRNYLTWSRHHSKAILNEMMKEKTEQDADRILMLEFIVNLFSGYEKSAAASILCIDCIVGETLGLVGDVYNLFERFSHEHVVPDVAQVN